MLQMLIDNTSTVTTGDLLWADIDGYTPLHLAAQKSSADIGEVLLNAAIMTQEVLDALDPQGNTALHLLCNCNGSLSSNAVGVKQNLFRLRAFSNCLSEDLGKADGGLFERVLGCWGTCLEHVNRQ